MIGDPGPWLSPAVLATRIYAPHRTSSRSRAHRWLRPHPVRRPRRPVGGPDPRAAGPAPGRRRAGSGPSPRSGVLPFVGDARPPALGWKFADGRAPAVALASPLSRRGAARTDQRVLSVDGPDALVRNVARGSRDVGLFGSAWSWRATVNRRALPRRDVGVSRRRVLAAIHRPCRASRDTWPSCSRATAPCRMVGRATGRRERCPGRRALGRRRARGAGRAQRLGRRDALPSRGGAQRSPLRTALWSVTPELHPGGGPPSDTRTVAAESTSTCSSRRAGPGDRADPRDLARGIHRSRGGRRQAVTAGSLRPRWPLARGMLQVRSPSSTTSIAATRSGAGQSHGLPSQPSEPIAP